MHKVRFIINPLSGRKKIKQIQTIAEQYLDKKLFDYSLIYTEHPKHGTLLAKQAAKEGINIVVAVGGDGSINEVVNGIYGTKTMLGIVPTGSGNGLARSLGIPLKTKKAIDHLNRFSVKEIDVCSANDYLFVSNAGIGFDTAVIQDFDKRSKRGFFTYLSVVYRQLFTYKSKEIELTVNKNTYHLNSFMLTIANAKQLGYGFKIASKAQLNDGLFKVVAIIPFPLLSRILLGFYAFIGKLHKSKFVQTKSGKSIRVYHPELQYFQVDGELRKCKQEVNIKLLPQKLSVLT